jgi:hypothetical protein
MTGEAIARIGYDRPMLAALLAASLLRPEFDFLGFGPYDAAVPEPSKVLGYRPGERHTTYDAQERVLRGIAEKAGERMRLLPYGKSTEGRELRIAVLSSPENMARIDRIREKWQTIAQGGKVDEKALADLPAVVWINECVHGDETASFESGMWLVYTLAASQSPRIGKMLSDTVVIVNPVYNPDGHERFVVWYNSVAVGSPSPRAFEQRPPAIIGGRTNHYRFDMNRDRIAMSQDESRQEAAEVLRWNPQVYVDQHGEVDTYFFPPCSMSVNVNVGRERYEKWTDIFGRASAMAFDKEGWLYFVRRTFDLYSMGYLDSWNTLAGAIGMTHETDGGSRLAIEKGRGLVTTLRDGMAKHLTSALATIEAAAAHREDLAKDYARFRSAAADGTAVGKFRRVIVTSRDPRPLVRLREQLALHGIASGFAAKPFRQRATAYDAGKISETDFPAGSLVVDLAQPQGMVAKALLEPGSDFEKEFVQRQEQSGREDDEKGPTPHEPGLEFYDITAWCAVYTHGLTGYWSSDTPAIALGDSPARTGSARFGKQGAFLRYTDRDDVLAVFDLLAAGVRVDVAGYGMKVGGQTLPAGTFLVLRQYNDDPEREAARVARERGVTIEPLDTAYPDGGGETGPGTDTESLAKPNIAVVFGGEGGTTSFGSVWYAMERTFRLPFTPVTTATLSDPGDLTCLVCPPGSYAAPSQALRDWVRRGGSLVVLGRPGWVLGERGLAKLEAREVRNIPGSIFRAEIDAESALADGYDASLPLPVPIDGEQVYKAAPSGRAVVSIPARKGQKNLLSGWAWPDSEDALRGTVWLHDEPLGEGHVFVFTQDPTERAMWPGLEKLLLNAMLAGRRE